MSIRKKRVPINFTQFIMQHVEEIFGGETSKIGKDYLVAYRKQINALNIKMNEMMDRDTPQAKDPVFLLGLFAMAISQFGVSVKTDVERYKDAFFALLEENEN